MNPLEERLQTHLGAQASSSAPDHAGLGAVKKRARRRSLQTRVVAGAFGLAALAGVASLVPTGDTTDSLITATEPTPETGEADDTAAPDTTQEPEAPRPQSAPTGYNVVADGNGGFVAPRFLGATERIRFLRSTDGRTWFDAEEPEMPEGFTASGFRFVDGFFVLVLDGAGDSDYPNLSPHLALSQDLLTWDVIDLGFEPDDGNGPAVVHYSVGEIAINGDDLAVVVLELSDINYQYFDVAEPDVCALVLEPTVTTLRLCDGELISSEVDLQPGIVQHVVVSRSGAPATELRDSEPVSGPIWDWTWRPATALQDQESFAVAEYGTDPAALVNAATAAELHALGDPQLVAVSSANGQRLLLVETDDGLRTVLAASTNESSNEVIAGLPAEIDPRSLRDSYRLAQGPAGWTISVSRIDAGLVEVERDEWRLLGDLNWDGAQLWTTDESEHVLFNSPSTALPHSIQLGLFGSVRYFHPVTGELMVELTRDESTSAAIAALEIDQAAFDRTVDVDGWTIGGHPLHGPITLTSPSGVVTEYADGFAFDNDDITDGVETDFGSRSFGEFALQRADTIHFYEDGVELVSVSGRDLFRDLVAPVLTMTDAAGELLLNSVTPDFRQEAFVVHTSDGSDWEVVWSPTIGEDHQPGPVTNVVVGDDEILVTLHNENVRIPIDD